MIESVDYIIGSRGVIDDGYGLAQLKEHVAHVNRNPAPTLERVRSLRATTPDAAKYWPAWLGALLYLAETVEQLSDELVDGLVSLDPDPKHVALRRLPAGLANVLDAEVVFRRVNRGLAELRTLTPLEHRIDALASLAEHALNAFDRAMRPDTKVGYQVHWLRPFADSMRTPLANILDQILRDVPTSNLNRQALFRRLWAWLRQGWLDQFRWVSTVPSAGEAHLRLAAMLETKADLEDAVALLRAETKTVQESPTFRPLLFELLSRLDDADGMRVALPASPTWAHHEAIVRAYEKLGQPDQAVTFLKTLRESAERNARLAKLLATTSQDEAFALERPLPSNLDSLGQRYAKSRTELIAVGLERMRPEYAKDWLAFLVREADWAHATMVAERANPEQVLALLTPSVPAAAAYELARTALEHLFDARHAWVDAERAKQVVRELFAKTLELVPDAKARAKVLKQARTRTNKVISKSSDFFTRELAFTLDEALAAHEPSATDS